MKRLIHKIGRAYQRKILRAEAEAQKFTRHNERPAEWAFVFRSICRCAPRTLLDIGTGTTALPALIANCGVVVTAIDNVRDYWQSGVFNRHWHVLDEDIQRTRLTDPYDMVTCISVLEHIADHRAAMRNIMRLVRPGGHLVLIGPYTDREHIDNTYKVDGADVASSKLPYICRSYSRDELNTWLSDSSGEVVDEEYWRGWSGRHWALGHRIAPPEPSSLEDTHNHACFLIRRAVA